MSNPRINTPNRDPALGPNRAPQRSLAEELAPVVDEARQLMTDLGMRPYRVFSVTLRWTGGERGRGASEVVSEREFLPTPRVVDLSGMRARAQENGVELRGDVRLREVSARYSDDDVRGMFHGCQQGAQFETFIEIREDARDGAEPRRKRFVVEVEPYRDAQRFEWVVVLSGQDGARARDGSQTTNLQTPAQVRMHRLLGGT